MRIKQNKKSTPQPSIKGAIDSGLYREIARHELPRGSWQQEMHDKGRRFYEGTGKEAKRLAHYAKGQPVISNVDGTPRYMYEDGTFDMGSTVSPEVEERAFKLGSIATNVRVEQSEQPSTDEEGINEVPETLGPLAVENAT